MIEDILIKIGLTEGEIQVYLALVGLGQSTTGRITDKARIASSKVYEVLQRLINKGLVSCVIINGVRNFDATPPERLVDFLEDKKEDLIKAQKDITKILPEIRARRRKVEEKNETVVYTGKQGPKIALNEALEAGKRKEELLGFGTDEDPFLVHYPYELEKHFKEQKKHKVKWKMLFSGGFKSPNPLAEIKYLPKGFTTPTRTFVYGNKVAIIDFHKPFTTIIIENKEVAESYKKHFYFLWDIAKD
jgi:sugar-specific transcriptional regulator TrmB